MEFLRLLEKIRNPFLDAIFLAITNLGGEIVFLVVAIAVFWCVDKREGFYVLITGLVGTLVNQALKLICKVPRPWRDPTFTAVDKAIADAGGYSFPSGHTQNVTGTFGGIAYWSSRKTTKIISVLIIFLVAFSRMYLGVHTPLDVGFSLLFGALLVILLRPIFINEERYDKFMPYVVVISSLLSLLHLVFVFTASTKGVDAENLYSAKENACTLFGCTLGLIPTYIIDKKYIKFDTDAAWYAQIIKLVLGFAVILLIKEGLKSPLIALFDNEFVARCVRYLLAVLFAGIVWPMTFKFFSRLRINALDNLTRKIKK